MSRKELVPKSEKEIKEILADDLVRDKSGFKIEITGSRNFIGF